MLSDIQSIRRQAHIRMIKHVNERETEGRYRNNKPKKIIIPNNCGNISVVVNTQSQSLKELETNQPSEASLTEEDGWQ